MKKMRLIARLDIKGPNLIKSIHLEGLRVIGAPNEYALDYYHQGIDELIYMDCVASLYERNNLSEIIQCAAENIFVPITVGGGVRSVDDAAHLLRCGADKIAVNTAAIANPKLITDIARRFGSQCVVLSIEAKQVTEGKWEAYTNNGRERTGLDVVAWAKQGMLLGAGEILLTSVDREGTRKGYDISLVQAVTDATLIPVIASGGLGKPFDLVDAIVLGNADAIAIADSLHYKRATVSDFKQVACSNGIEVRQYA